MSETHGTGGFKLLLWLVGTELSKNAGAGGSVCVYVCVYVCVCVREYVCVFRLVLNYYIWQ
jgi:hypothetical protein